MILFYFIVFIPFLFVFFFSSRLRGFIRSAAQRALPRSHPDPLRSFFSVFSPMGYETIKDLTAGTVGGIAQVHLENMLVRTRSCHLTVRMLCVPPGPRRSTF